MPGPAALPSISSSHRGSGAGGSSSAPQAGLLPVSYDTGVSYSHGMPVDRSYASGATVSNGSASRSANRRIRAGLPDTRSYAVRPAATTAQRTYRNQSEPGEP